tara:strand:+ start:3093 stop:4496 length:1404 start_codon:yes stop_codon:yes gene_type:complete
MASFALTTKPTPFGVYDNDDHFKEEADSIILYVKRKLGDDVMSVELTSKQIWANFEEAVLVFSKQINAHQAESYLSNLYGIKIGQNETFKKNAAGEYVDANDAKLTIQDTFDARFVNGNTLASDETTPASPVVELRVGPHGKEQKLPRETLDYLVRRAEPYASESGVGGVNNVLRGFIKLEQNKQDYNIYSDMVIPAPDGTELSLIEFDGTAATSKSLFNPLYRDQLLKTASPTKIKLFEVFHFSPQAAYRFFDTTSAINYLNNQFAFESFTPETVFYVLPVFEDLLRAGQLDISNRVRRSNFSYKLQGQDLRIFPRPTQSNPLNLFIKFGFPSDPYAPNLPYDDESIDGVSNISNVPFGNIPFKGINSMSRQWIRQYTLALCKETLGLIRSKFSTVPIPGSDLSMNGAELISQGREDKAKLNEGLGETLDRLTYQKIIESDAAQSESMMNILKRVPVPNGRAIIMG